MSESLRLFRFMNNPDDDTPVRIGKILCAGMLVLGVIAIAVRGGRTPPAAGMAVKTPSTPALRVEAPESTFTVLPAAKFEPAPPDRVGRALNDSVLNTLIDNFIVASARNDAATQKAMLSGLKRDAARSRELLRSRAASGVPSAAVAVDRALAGLNQN